MSEDGPHWRWDGMNFKPITPTGWKQLGFWMLPFFAGLGVVATVAALRPDAIPWVVGLYLVATTVWAVALILWCRRQI